MSQSGAEELFFDRGFVMGPQPRPARTEGDGMKELWRDLPDAETIIAETRAELDRLNKHERGRGTIALGRAVIALERAQFDLKAEKAAMKDDRSELEELRADSTWWEDTQEWLRGKHIHIVEVDEGYGVVQLGKEQERGDFHLNLEFAVERMHNE